LSKTAIIRAASSQTMGTWQPCSDLMSVPTNAWLHWWF